MSGSKANQRGTPGVDTKSRRKQRVEESKLTIQSQDDDEADNFFSKQLAAARFQRNHRLINILFSDYVVDQEPLSDQNKLQACKKRVKNLMDYQKKIDDEITEMNEKFATKRRKIMDDSKIFAEKLTTLIANSKVEVEKLKSARELRLSMMAHEKSQQDEVRQILDKVLDSIANTV